VEIDGILLSHPSVAEAVCFAVPDEMYGQDIHAAVVPAQGKQVNEKELQEFLATKIAKFKVPKKVYLLRAVLIRFISPMKFQRRRRGKFKEQKLVRPSLNLRNQRPSYKWDQSSEYNWSVAKLRHCLRYSCYDMHT
jgi:acyl-CoA synthetase (AMP-forming)/AMP-acid ligase II